MMKIIISDCDHADMIQEEAVLAAAGMEYVWKACKTEEDLLREVAGYNIAFTQYGLFTRNVISQLAPDLKLIVRYGVGYDTIDMEAAKEYGVQVCNIPDYGMNEVADQAMAMTLALARKLALMDQYTKHENWNFIHACPIHRIPGSVVATIGFGRIAKVYQKRMSGFDVERIAYDPFYTVGDVIDGVRIVTFDEVIERADIVSIHCALLPETKNMFTLDVMKKMKPTALLINTARGGIINEDDLYVALTEGIITGAGIDVVAQEPLPVGHPLLTLDNLLCTPHMGWHSAESALELKTKVAEEGVSFAQGKGVRYGLIKFD